MSSCVYDNPMNFTRECWAEGTLMWMYSKALMEQFPEAHAHVLPWESGRVVGDIESLPQYIKDRIRNEYQA